ncbi:hypothetical protein ACFLZW_06510 [Chloroflexota bacterium]
MAILSLIVLPLLTLTGYSMGATLGSSGKRVSPGLLDLFFVLLLWVGAFLTRGGMGKWLAILVWLLIGLLVGLALTWRRRSGYPAEDQTLVEAPNWWRSAWQRWLGFSKKFGDYQSRVLLAFLYFTLVLPFGLGLQAFSDPLNTRKMPDASAWHTWGDSPKSVDEARRQF